TNTPTIAANVQNASVVGNVIIKLSTSGTLLYALPIDLPFTSQITSIQGDNSMVNEGLYIGGFYDDPTGTETIYNNIVPASAIEDMFILKLDYDGTQLDIKYFGGDGEDRIEDMAKLPGSELHIAGTSNSSSLVLDGITLTIPPANESDIFVATFDFSLTTLTAFNDGGPGYQYCHRMDLNSAGDIALFGLMETTGDFSGTVLNNVPFDPGNFLASYQSSGTLVFANEIIVSPDPVSSFTDLAIDNSGNTYISGLYIDPIDFGNGTLAKSGDTDGFIVSYDNTGSINYAELIGGDYTIGTETFRGFDGSYSLATNSLDDVWVTGTLAVKPTDLGSFSLQPASSELFGYVEGQNTYLVKITMNGAVPTVDQPKVYWTDFSEINRSNLDGTSFENYHAEASYEPVGIAIDTLNKTIYWTNNRGQIRKGEIDATGLINVTDFINDGVDQNRTMSGLTLDVASGKIYWASTYDRSIKSADLFDADPLSTIQTMTMVVGFPVGIALDPVNAQLYYTLNDNQEATIDNIATLHQFDIATADDQILHTTQVTGQDYAYNDVKLDLTNNLIYWSGSNNDEFSPQGEIYYANLLDVGGSLITFNTFNDNPIGIDLDLKNGDIYWVDGYVYMTDPVIAKAKLDGSNQTVIQPGFPNVSGPKFIALNISQPTTGCVDPPTVDTGSDQTICQANSVSLSAVIGGAATSVTWTTNGDGTFDNNTSLTAIYSPGSNDLVNTMVTLTVTTDDPDGTGPCLAATDDIVINIEQSPTVDAGIDQNTCASEPVTLAGTIGGSALSANWTSSGDGSFDNASSLTASYSPGSYDISNGNVTLTLTSTLNQVCAPVLDQMTITINQPITVIDQSGTLNVGETITINVTNGVTLNSGNIISTTLQTQPQKGTASVNSDGNIEYTALLGTVGADSFSFEACNQCGLCSSAMVNISINNTPPSVDVPPSEIVSGGIMTMNILSNITDDNDNVDLSSLKIISQPISGAIASIDGEANLTVDYQGIKFTGMDELSIEICDFEGLCSQQVIQIMVAPPTVNVYNAVSPNGDGKHDFLEIENIEFFPNNRVRILNRWGDIVFEIAGYNNADNRFDGTSNKGSNSDLPPGTYYYSIILNNESNEINGFLTLRR
ncbi:MAG: hypothetical protein DRI71_12390, partial [Bacteroidetes bacterium]